MYPS
jgi:hypothetical protein